MSDNDCQSAAQKAAALIASWGTAARPVSSDASANAAERMLLCRSLDGRGLGLLASNELSHPAKRPGLYFYAGPCRRSFPSGNVSGAVALCPDVEREEAAGATTAAPYDTGGMERYIGMDRAQRVACKVAWTFSILDYRVYLRALLLHAYAAPHHYLDDECQPLISPTAMADEPAGQGLLKALRTANAPSWTAEVILRPDEQELRLDWLCERGLVHGVFVFGAEYESQAERIAARIGADRVLCEGEPVPLSEGERSIQRRQVDLAKGYVEAAAWSRAQQEDAWEM